MMTQHQSLRHVSDEAVLSILVGKRIAKKIIKTCSHYLAPFSNIHLNETLGGNLAMTKLNAAREFATRSLYHQVKDRDVFNSPDLVRDFLRHQMAGLEHEEFLVMFLDVGNQLIAFEVMFRGSVSQTSVYPREIVKRVLQLNAAAVFLVHNHPGGTTEASEADKTITEIIKRALRLIDVKVLDHFIVAGASIASFSEQGYL